MEGSMSAREVFESTCRDSASALYLGDQTLLITPLGAIRNGGLRMVVDSSDRGIVPHLALDGFWEAWVSVWFARELSSGRSEHVLNIGANCGYYALFAAAMQPHVVAVEPNATHVRNLRHSAHLAGLFDRLRVVRGVCSDQPREVELKALHGNSMNGFVEGSEATLKEMDTARASMEDTFVTTRATAYTADELMPDTTLMLADTEGHEPFVWAGAKAIRSNPTFRAAIEWSPGRYDDPDGFYESIRAEGFGFSRIAEDGAEQPISRDQLMAAEHMVALRR